MCGGRLCAGGGIDIEDARRRERELPDDVAELRREEREVVEGIGRHACFRFERGLRCGLRRGIHIKDEAAPVWRRE